MKIVTTTITKEGNFWQVTITDGNGMKVHIHDCETKAIAKQQAKDRVNELKRGHTL